LWAVSNVSVQLQLQRRRLAVATAGKHRVGGASAHIVHVHHLRCIVALKQNGGQIQFGGNDDIVFTRIAGVLAAGARFVEAFVRKRKILIIESAMVRKSRGKQCRLIPIYHQQQE